MPTHAQNKATEEWLERWAPSAHSLVLPSMLALLFGVPTLMAFGIFPVASPVAFVLSMIFVTMVFRHLVIEIQDQEYFEVPLGFWTPTSYKSGKWHDLSFRIPMPNEKWAVKLIVIGSLLGLLILPIILGVAGKSQWSHFSNAMDFDISEITKQLSGDEKAVTEGGDEGAEKKSGLNFADAEALKNSVTEQAVSTIKKAAGTIAATIGGVLGKIGSSYFKLFVAMLVIGTYLVTENYLKERKHFEYVVRRSLPHKGMQENIMNFFAYWQESLGTFALGYLKIGLLLTVYFGLMMLIMPFNMSIPAIILMSFMLGFITAIPKIGGLISAFVAFLYMITLPGNGLGWSFLGIGFSLEGWISSYGWVINIGPISYQIGAGFDHIMVTIIFATAAKTLGLFEAYRFTPEILGDRLGITKMSIILVVLGYVMAGGFFGMVWGVIFLCAYQALLRVSNDGKSPGQHGWKLAEEMEETPAAAETV